MWKKLSSNLIFTHPRIKLIEDKVITGKGDKINYLKFQENNDGAVTIIARRDDGKFLIQREYSYPPNQKLFQFPGGAINKNEKIEKAANRELMEEMNFKANNLQLLGYYLVNNRRSDKKMYVFLGTNLEEKFLKADKEEEIESFWLAENELEKMIADGKIINCHFLASWTIYKNKK